MKTNSVSNLSRKWLYLLEFRMLTRLAMPVLRKSYPPEEIHTIVAQVRKEFENILPQIPDIGGKRPFSEFLLFTAVSLAFYRINRLHGKSVEQTGIMLYEIGDLILKSPLAMLLGRLTPINFTPRYYQRLQSRATESLKRTYTDDYVYNFVPGDGGTFDFGVDYIECGGCKFLLSQGAPELAPYLCTVDVLYSQAFGWGLSRTTTLAEGAEKCDFRFKKGGGTHIQVPVAVEEFVNSQDDEPVL